MGYLTPSQRLAIRARGGRMQGDPFIGALVAGLATKVLPKLGGLAKGIASRFGGAGARRVAGAAGAIGGKLAKGVRSPLGRALAGGAAAGGAGALLGRALSGRRGGGGGPRRRMHVTNTKALSRAMRRVEGFAKLARRTISFTKAVKMKKCRGRRAA